MLAKNTNLKNVWSCECEANHKVGRKWKHKTTSSNKIPEEKNEHANQDARASQFH